MESRLAQQIAKEPTQPASQPSGQTFQSSSQSHRHSLVIIIIKVIITMMTCRREHSSSWPCNCNFTVHLLWGGAPSVAASISLRRRSIPLSFSRGTIISSLFLADILFDALEWRHSIRPNSKRPRTYFIAAPLPIIIDWARAVGGGV